MNRTAWFARHELRLAWRDFTWMVTAGKPGRLRLALVVMAIFVLMLHGFAWTLVAPYAGVTFPPDRETLLVVTGGAFLAWTVMVSQAMESVTRAFYARSDLDLLLSSPASTRPIFALRIATIGIATSGLSLVLVGPVVNALAVAGGPRWLAAYGVLLALAAAATALAAGLAVLLFQTLGPRRTRFVAQVVAAVIGAVFVIGVQVVSIFAYDNLSRFDAFHSQWAMRMAPNLDSLFWLPARAAMGDLSALAVVAASGLAAFGLAVSVASQHFGRFAGAAAAAGVSSAPNANARPFRRSSPAAALRRKEWTLLRRDPWLASQTLMQVLYLIPPAVLLWRNYGAQTGTPVMLAPVLVMAAGQLAGGLAWLAISGEDAPDLVSTAPVRRSAILRAKIEAVIASVAFVLAPMVIALAVVSPWTALVTAVGAVIAAACATAVQLFFRAQARRSQFRRRQTSSRLATFAEAFSSLGWAATAALAAAGNPLTLAAAFATMLIVATAWMLSPKQALA